MEYGLDSAEKTLDSSQPKSPRAHTEAGTATSVAFRYAGTMRWASISIVIASVAVIAWALPTAQAIGWLQQLIADLGVWGWILFIAIYVLAALMLVPGSALTIAAGVLFGLLWGTVIVSAASTIAAALAFLIARHAGRRWVERLAQRYPRFSAVDQAIEEGGWKVEALLRLSPVVPYSASNYLFGLTAVRFWPYVLTSWLAMLPGTVLYVYLGHAGLRGVAAASGTTEWTPGEWILLIVGLAATVAVTIHLTLMARRRIQERVVGGTSVNANNPADRHSGRESGNESGYGRWRVAAWPLVAALSAVTAVGMTCNRGVLKNRFGPPAVQMKEEYENQREGASFDHGVFNELLRKYVADGGWVDYRGVLSDASQLDAYIASLKEAPFEQLSRDEKLALLINAYNAFTLRLILDFWDGGKLMSIKDIPDEKRWDDPRWKIGPYTWSLNQIEHEQIRPKFSEPRIHFALVCAAVGCPPLRSEAYTGSRIEEQLADQARYVHTHDRWFRFDAPSGVVRLTELYNWYGGDFKQASGSILAYAAKYSTDLQSALDKKRKLRTEWLEYDWRLNSVENKP